MHACGKQRAEEPRVQGACRCALGRCFCCRARARGRPAGAFEFVELLELVALLAEAHLDASDEHAVRLEVPLAHAVPLQVRLLGCEVLAAAVDLSACASGQGGALRLHDVTVRNGLALQNGRQRRAVCAQ